jgi:hydrogenase maturation protease
MRSTASAGESERGGAGSRVRTLVIGYGNPSRRDDGVALTVINGLRQRLGLPSLTDNDDGYDDLGSAVDTLFMQQLTPELSQTMSAYDAVIFVDAHVGKFPEMIRRVAVGVSAEPAIVSHHVKPGALLEIALRLYGHAPAGELVSVRGFDFDFGEELTPATAAAAEQVVGEIWRTVGGS